MARTLQPLVEGRRILGCRVIHPVVTKGRARAVLEAKGRTVVSVERRGKYLLLALDRGWLALHFRLSGQLLWYERRHAPKHVDVALDFAQGTLGFVDRRHLGRVYWLDRPEDIPGLARMGVDPMSAEFTPERLGEILRESRRAVKLVLMDQGKIAGLGNIWTSESLWRARIDPRRRADRLTEAETRRLAGTVVGVVRRAIESCLDPAPNFRDPDWWFEGGDRAIRVYDREGKRCPRCGTAIERIAQGGRSTYYCPGCQTKARKGALQRARRGER
ncbi:MAG: DNA-formamidopyrimidine glycosylase [Acidobacteriota bacterium]|nr:DNA-formamidopyrimidine glycosylase [Acidobacteriota bacterium]